VPVVATRRLRNTDVLASDVWSNTGRLLCAKGTSVSDQIISQFDRFGVDLVHVEERTGDELTYLTDAQAKELEEAIEQRFADVQGDRFLMRLKVAVVSTVVSQLEESEEEMHGGLTAREFLESAKESVVEHRPAQPIELSAQVPLRCVVLMDDDQQLKTIGTDGPQLHCVSIVDGGHEIASAELRVQMPRIEELEPNYDDMPVSAELVVSLANPKSVDVDLNAPRSKISTEVQPMEESTLEQGIISGPAIETLNESAQDISIDHSELAKASISALSDTEPKDSTVLASFVSSELHLDAESLKCLSLLGEDASTSSSGLSVSLPEFHTISIEEHTGERGFSGLRVNSQIGPGDPQHRELCVSVSSLQCVTVLDDGDNPEHTEIRIQVPSLKALSLLEGGKTLAVEDLQSRIPMFDELSGLELHEGSSAEIRIKLDSLRCVSIFDDEETHTVYGPPSDVDGREDKPVEEGREAKSHLFDQNVNTTDSRTD